jgi:hypothetical protein
MVAGGHAVVAAAGGADDELDDLLIALGQPASTVSAASTALSAAGPWAAMAAKVFGTLPIAFLIWA